ncbi:MAG TPA: polyphenol oxidase family protein [Gemmatimonadaceae bacterium]|nr:polyphenol oxidase family protein [Gemmatimonadaceae bacterium]
MTTAASLPLREPVRELGALGVKAFTTTRAAGDFGLGDGEPSPAAIARWQSLQLDLAPVAPRLASARQMHGVRILEHGVTWDGWLRTDGADGHLSVSPGIACAVTVADCVPVFIAHPSGAIALLHAGWRGTAARIVQKGIQRMGERALAASDLRLHLGPAICGRCYVVGTDVFQQLTGWTTSRPRNVDLRALIAEQAKDAGVTHITVSEYCTRCDNNRFFSHRAGDAGRQVGVIISPVAERDSRRTSR